jgi:general secretion pathway protein G
MFRRLIVSLLIIISILCAASCRASKEYDKSALHARETVLRDDLFQLRKIIDLYAADRGFLPQSLDDVVKAGYLREVPDDPFTGKKDWKIVIGDDPGSAKGGKGIVDVHSASTAKSSEGKPYSEW